MNNSYDLMTIYGIPPAKYSEDNPDDLFLKNLPSLEQIASFNLGYLQNNQQRPMQNNQNSQSVSNMPDVNNISTPTTSLGYMPADNISTIRPNNQGTDSASAETSELTQMITDFSNPYPVTAESIQYLNGFIRTQIGRRVQVEFLMGNAELIEKDGFLLGVGANYILINEIGTNDITACDFYNIKFIRFLY